MLHCFKVPKMLLIIVAWFLVTTGQATMRPLDDCVDRFKKNQTQDIILQHDCPDFYFFLQQENILQPSDALLSERLTYSQIKFLQRNLGPTAEIRWQPEFYNLQQLLDRILVKTNRDNDWKSWDAFINWLKQLKLEQYAEGLTDFANMIQAITPSKETMKIILATIITMVFIMILYFVAVEFRLAGLFNWPFNKVKGGFAGSGWIEPGQQQLDWQQLLLLPPQKQPAAVLKYIINFLTINEQLEYKPACTNQELLIILKKASAPKAADFKKILLDVEPVIYGNCVADEIMLQRIRQTARLITAPEKNLEG